jgi:phosphoserine phosphatase
MNGEMDFHTALNERVALLKELPVAALEDTLDQLKINPGAQTMVKTMRENGCHCVLVSGGFTFFTAAVAEKLLFMNHHGNVLDIENDTLTGRVKPPILDKDAKVGFLHHYINTHEIQPEDCMTIGDGANDLPMLKMAGFGVGYKAKETVKKDIENQIIHGDFTAALYAQGYGEKDILEP